MDDPNSLVDLVKTLGGVSGVVSGVLAWIVVGLRQENARLTQALVDIATQKRSEEKPPEAK